MFEPNNRHNLLDLLRPPDGYRLDAAVGTTYSLDFVALTAVMLTFIDAEPEGEDGLANQAEALRAITRLSGQVRVFVNRGRISLNLKSQPNKLLSLYDSVVREVRIKGRSFHPKVWVVRLTPRALPGTVELKPIVRLICASRNLTTSQYWEAFVCFEGFEDSGLRKRGLQTEISQFLRKLADNSPTDDCLERLIEAVGRTHFQSPQECLERCQFLWQWKEKQELLEHVPNTGEETLVMAPFVGKGFLEELMNRFERLTLVSTQRALDEIKDDVFHEKLGKQKAYVIQPVADDEGSPTMDLHAKLLICQSGGHNTMFLGSANATNSAWRLGNCEAMVAFSPAVSIRQFHNSFLFDKEGKLAGWVDEYKRRSLVTTEADRADQELNDMLELVAGLNLSAAYDQAGQRLTVRATGSEMQRQIAQASTRIAVRACPLSLLGVPGALVPVDKLFPVGLIFDGVTLAELSEFVVFELVHVATGESRTVVVMARLNWGRLRRGRDSAVLKSLLTKECFEEFLRAILRGRAAPQTITPPGPGQPGWGWAGALRWEASLETVLQACTEDAGRIDEIDHLLKTFEGTGFVDPSFAQFWATFRATFDIHQGMRHG